MGMFDNYSSSIPGRTKNFIQKFNGNIVNIHPSLLPKYKGLNTHKKAIENNPSCST